MKRQPWIKGQRVKFHTTKHQYPFTIVRKGETGTIALVQNTGDKIVSIKLDKLHSGLEEWNNELYFHRSSRGGSDAPSNYIRKIK